MDMVPVPLVVRNIVLIELMELRKPMAPAAADKPLAP